MDYVANSISLLSRLGLGHQQCTVDSPPSSQQYISSSHYGPGEFGSSADTAREDDEDRPHKRFRSEVDELDRIVAILKLSMRMLPDQQYLKM